MYWSSWNLGASTCWNPQDLTRPVQGLLSLYIFSSDILHTHSSLPVWTSKMAVSLENLLCASHCQERLWFVILFSNPYYVKTFCETFGSYCFCFRFHRTYEHFIIGISSKNTMILLRGNICGMCLVRIRTVTHYSNWGVSSFLSSGKAKTRIISYIRLWLFLPTFCPIHLPLTNYFFWLMGLEWQRR
jgi:hypothetical protein